MKKSGLLNPVQVFLLRDILTIAIFTTIFIFFSQVTLARSFTYSCANTPHELEDDALNALANSTGGLNDGDEIVLTRGQTCAGPLLLTQRHNITVRAADGSGTQPVIKAGNNGTVTDPDGKTYPRYVSVSIEGGSNNTIQNISLRGADGLAPITIGECRVIQARVYGAIITESSHHNLLQNLDISGFTTGVHIDGGTYNNIQYNRIHDNTLMGLTDTIPSNDWGAIGVNLSGSDNNVAYNEFTNNQACSYDFGTDGSAIEIYNGSRNMIHHNRAYNNPNFSELGGEPNAGGTADNTYFYNLVVAEHLPKFGNAKVSHISFLETHGGTTLAKRTIAYNNTIYLKGYSQGTYCESCNDHDGDPILTFYNNIVAIDASAYPGQSYLGSFADTSGNSALYSHFTNNVFYCPLCKLWDSPDDNVFIPVTSQLKNKQADPQFVKINSQSLFTSDFHLKRTSPAIGQGIKHSITHDLDNRSVLLDSYSTVDIGAYAYPANN